MGMFETSQEGVNPATANVSSVVDNTAAAAISGAVGITESVFAAQDQHALSVFGDDLTDIDTSVEDDSAERLAIISGFNSGESEAIKDADRRLTTLGKSVRQGRMSEAAADAMKQDLLKRKIADKPWLATEFKSLASTHNVSGMRSSSQSKDDPIVKAQNAFLQQAAALQMVPGLSLQQRMVLLQKATLGESLFKEVSASSKAEHLPALQDHANVVSYKLAVELGNYINTSGREYNPHAATALVEKTRGELTRELKSNIARHRSAGIPLDYSDAEVDGIVGNVLGYYEAVIKMNDPQEIVKQTEAVMTLKTQNGHANITRNNKLLDAVFQVYQVYQNPDPRSIEKAMELYGRMWNARDKAEGVFTKTLREKNPEWAHVLAIYDADPAGALATLHANNQRGVQIGNPLDAELNKVLGGAALEGNNSPQAREALNALFNNSSPMVYEVFKKFVPSDDNPLPPPKDMERLVNKMAFDLDAASSIFAQDWTEVVPVGEMPEVDPISSGEVGQQQTMIRQKYQIVYDPHSNRLSMWNVNGDRERVSQVQGSEHRRLLIALNRQLEVRDKFGIWEEGTKQDFINRFTQGMEPFPQRGGGFYTPYKEPVDIDRTLNTGALVRRDGVVVGTEPMRPTIRPPLQDIGDPAVPSTEGITIPRGGVSKILKDNMAARDAILGTSPVPEEWELVNGTWTKK